MSFIRRRRVNMWGVPRGVSKEEEDDLPRVPLH